MYDYIANILASAVLANGNEDRNKILREEHQKVMEELFQNIKKS